MASTPRIAELAEALADEGTGALEAFVERTPPSERWLAELVEGVGDALTSVAASWLLRAYLERGAPLDRAATAALIRSLARLGPADARLHVCQLVAKLEIPGRNAEQLARFLRDCSAAEHKFLRAWGVDGLWRLALQHPRYRAEAQRALARAEGDPAASVRARVRQILRERS